MDFRAETTIAAPRQRVFAAYLDTTTWSDWDPELAATDFPQGITVGASGGLTMKQGTKVKLTVASVTPDHGFVVETALPLARMTFGHELLDQAGGTLAVHWISFSGPLGFIFRRLIGPNIAKSLPGTLEGLKRFCEG